MTFVRHLHWFLLLLTAVNCHSQSSSPYAPEPGVYTGGTLNVTGTINYSYNPIMGFGTQAGTSVTPGVNLLGDLTITTTGGNKGTYSFSKLKDWKGQWQYDPEKDKMSFAGPAQDAFRYYHAGNGAYNFTFIIKVNANDKSGVTYSYTKKASKPFPKLVRPNGDLTGVVTVKPDINTIAFLDIASGGIKKSFVGNTALTNNNHYTIAIGFTDNTKYYQISVIDPSGNAKKYPSSQIMSFNWNFFNYKYGLLNYDQDRMALLGQTPDSYLNLTYTPGYLAVGVFDMKGNALGIFPGQDNTFIIPSFLPDGRLVYCPKGGGIAITDPSYKRSKNIYANPVNALAVSPDGKTIAFSESLHFYTMNIDGNNKKQIICDGEYLTADNTDNVITLAWAPDGKHVAVSYKMNDKYGILIVPLDGSAYRFVKDEEGEIYRHAGQLVSWH